jgi:hypothetical protein
LRLTRISPTRWLSDLWVRVCVCVCVCACVDDQQQRQQPSSARRNHPPVSSSACECLRARLWISRAPAMLSALYARSRVLVCPPHASPRRPNLRVTYSNRHRASAHTA